MRTKGLSILIVVVLLLSIPAIAKRTERQGNRFNHREKTTKTEMRERTGNDFFTAEQKEAVKSIRLETAKEIKPLRNQLQELEANQKTITTATKADLNAIYKNIENMADIKTAMAKITAKQHQDIRAMLTEEQLLKFDQFGDYRRENRKEFQNNRERGNKMGRVPFRGKE